MITTMNRYIAKRVFYGILLAFVIITSIIMLVDFVEASRNLGSEADASLLSVLALTGLNAPQLVEKTIPFVVLFGVMGTLFGLNKRSELIVMRASGLSAWRFLRPAIFVTALLGIVWAIAFNPLASLSAQKYQSLMRQVSGGAAQSTPANSNSIWLREGNEEGQLVIHALSADIEAHTLYDVTFYYFEFDKNKRPVFSTRYDAKRAELFKTNYWVLFSVTENEDDGANREFKTVSKTTNISWDTLRTRSQSRKSPPFWKIRAEIDKAKSAGFDTAPMILQFHKLLALPLTLIAMTIIAAGASLNMSREGGTLRLLIAGGFLGFGVYFTDNIISAFGATGTLPPVLAAWSVSLIVLSLGLVFLSKIEDG